MPKYPRKAKFKNISRDVIVERNGYVFHPGEVVEVEIGHPKDELVFRAPRWLEPVEGEEKEEKDESKKAKSKKHGK